jgi:hypothetical protein
MSSPEHSVRRAVRDVDLGTFSREQRSEDTQQPECSSLTMEKI